MLCGVLAGAVGTGGSGGLDDLGILPEKENKKLGCDTDKVMGSTLLDEDY